LYFLEFPTTKRLKPIGSFYIFDFFFPNLRSASVSLLFAKYCVEVPGSAFKQSLKLEPVADAELLVAEALTDPEDDAVTEADVGATDEDG
jgi:hypothetical protein